jgi:hypothetical protein
MSSMINSLVQARLVVVVVKLTVLTEAHLHRAKTQVVGVAQLTQIIITIIIQI